jgi:hypothetical protein
LSDFKAKECNAEGALKIAPSVVVSVVISDEVALVVFAVVVAFTVNVYAVLAVNPVTVNVVPLSEYDPPPLNVYVIAFAEPPAGSVNVTVAVEKLVAVATTFVGAAINVFTELLPSELGVV